MSYPDLPELSSLTIHVLIDNELDPISPSPNPSITQTGNMRTLGMTGTPLENHHRSGAVKELRMSQICCGAHGLSLLITGTTATGDMHTVLFDTGPEEDVWERNVTRLKADVGKVETLQLSHWHRDHSGGMLKAISMINAAKAEGEERVKVDLHPARPRYRGFQAPDAPVISLEADPSFEEIEAAGGEVVKSSSPHLVGGGFFLISNEIPRVTSYEHGLRFGMRLDEDASAWKRDEEMADERFLLCNLKDKGLILFTGCSHAGVVNACRHGLTLGNGVPLYAVMGGFHLADAEKEQIEATARDLRALGVGVLMTGHCTGWRAKFELVKVFGEGSLVPSFVGSRFEL